MFQSYASQTLITWIFCENAESNLVDLRWDPDIPNKLPDDANTSRTNATR